jgi:hypothetical protein
MLLPFIIIIFQLILYSIVFFPQCSNNCSLTFTSCTSTVSCTLSIYFLMFVILNLTAALFLMPYWFWNMVLRIVRKEPTYQFMCCYNPRFHLYTLATVLLGSCHPLLLCCVVIFLVEIIMLVMLNRVDANPQSSIGGPMNNADIN